MNRSYYSASIESFLATSPDAILGELTRASEFSVDQTQAVAWIEQINILKPILQSYTRIPQAEAPASKSYAEASHTTSPGAAGSSAASPFAEASLGGAPGTSHSAGAIYFEYAIPRMGKRIDVLLIINSVLLVLEFKTGEKEYHGYHIDQVWDYTLDLKNFHETSHDKIVIPILVATNAKTADLAIPLNLQHDRILNPVRSNASMLGPIIRNLVDYFDDEAPIGVCEWEGGRYCPTPTIIEAATALYNNHSVADISRSDAGAINLTQTSNTISTIIRQSKENSDKAIVFVTGVPGAGKTLVGLDIATRHFEKASELYSVFLSGNGPLVKILQEALARDQVSRARMAGEKLKIGKARSEVRAFIQNVHHFRDEGLRDEQPPVEHVALFDEAQRAWTLEQTTKFMQQKKQIPNFNFSEPEFLISCLDRHPDWAVVVCLVGGGQEINTGEAGIGEWIHALERSFPKWKIYISNRLSDSEYQAAEILTSINGRLSVTHLESLHLAVSMRSYRAENVSLLVKQLLDLDIEGARETLKQIQDKYPIVITRDLQKAKQWLRQKARGSERYGIVVSSQAQRLKPYAIDVKSPIDPIHWFLDEKDDIRSSYYLEDVATEFDVQGLELDWTCVTWDADFRYTPNGWEHWSFKGNKWYHINKEERRTYLKNAYRVLLTRARQGMVIVVPPGDSEDPTRKPEFYDETFEYLKRVRFWVL
jgi:hypothetical protein